MTEEKQIEEMAEDIKEAISHNLTVTVTGKILGFNVEGIARELCDDGYRKQSEIAQKIFEEIDSKCIDPFGNFNYKRYVELKQKMKNES